MLLAKNNDFLVLVDKNGGILVRADDPEKIGGSLSDDQLVKKALQGDEVSGIVTRDGVMAPTVSVRSAVPIKSGDGILGVVTIGSTIDNAFVDGLKNATGLDASIYADNIRSATTFIAPDGKSRWIGIKEENKDVRKTVLNDGDIFTGTVSILNIFYLSAFTPIVNVDGNPIGMLFVGKPEVSTLQTAGDLIEQTFLVTVALLILSIFPSYIVSKYIIGQIR
jgi:sensor histidine kinase regulating citrate/malate metabolism